MSSNLTASKAETSVFSLSVNANPPLTKNFSDSSPALWVMATTPGLNCSAKGEWPAVTPYSPLAPGRVTLATLVSK